MNTNNLDAIKKNFVSKELAELLKKYGFNELCFASIYLDQFRPENILNPYPNCAYTVKLPLYQQVTDWLRLRHNIFAYIETDIIHGSEIHTGKILGAFIPMDVYADSGDYYETYNKLIEESLKLIK